MFLSTVRDIEKFLNSAPGRINRGFPVKIVEKRLDELFHQLIMSLNQEFEQLTDHNVIKAKIVEFLVSLESLQAQYDEHLGIGFWSKLLSVMTILRTKCWRYAFEESDIQAYIAELLSYTLMKAGLEQQMVLPNEIKNFKEFISKYRFILTMGLEYWTLMDDMHLVDSSDYVEWLKKCLQSFDVLIRYIDYFLKKMRNDHSFVSEIDLETMKNNYISFLSIYHQVYFIALSLLRRATNGQVIIPSSTDIFDSKTCFTTMEFLEHVDSWTHRIVEFMSDFVSVLEERLPRLYHNLVQQGMFHSPDLMFFQNILSIQLLKTNQYRVLDNMFGTASLSLETSFSCNDDVLLKNFRLLANELEYRIKKHWERIQNPDVLAAKADVILELTTLIENLSCQLMYFQETINASRIINKIKTYDTVLRRLPLGTFSFQEIYLGTMALLAYYLKNACNESKLLEYVMESLENLRKKIRIRVADKITVELLVQLLRAHASKVIPRLHLEESLLKRVPPSFQSIVLEYMSYCNELVINPSIQMPPLLQQRARHFSIADPLTWIVLEFPFKVQDSRAIVKLRFIPFNFYIDRHLGLNP